MDCPKCRDEVLVEAQAAPGLVVDWCRSCRGVWLDKSEVYRFVKQPQKLFDEMSKAYQSVHPSDFSCPRCSKMMLHASLETIDLMFETCPDCRGTWFDQGEIEKLQAEMARETKTAGPGSQAPAPAAASEQGTPSPAPSGDRRTARASGDGGSLPPETPGSGRPLPVGGGGGTPSPETPGSGRPLPVGGGGGTPSPETPGSGRPLTAMESAAVFGAEPVFVFGVVVAFAGFSAGLGGLVLGAMRKLPIRPADAGVFLLAVAAFSGVIFFVARSRRRARGEARMVRGTLTGIRSLASGPWGEVEVAVRYDFRGNEYRVVRKASFNVFGDLAEGSTVGVVVLPGLPSQGSVVRAP